MITLLVFLILFIVFKIVVFTLKLALGMTGGILLALGCPFILLAIFTILIL